MEEIDGKVEVKSEMPKEATEFSDVLIFRAQSRKF
jgi:hypothetical protein